MGKYITEDDKEKILMLWPYNLSKVIFKDDNPLEISLTGLDLALSHLDVDKIKLILLRYREYMTYDKIMSITGLEDVDKINEKIHIAITILRSYADCIKSKSIKEFEYPISKTKIHSDILNINLSVIDIHPLAIWELKQNGIDNILKLTKMAPHELWYTKYIGQSRFIKILEYLKSHELSLSCDDNVELNYRKSYKIYKQYFSD